MMMITHTAVRNLIVITYLAAVSLYVYVCTYLLRDRV